jgi:hypothetical protein
LLRSQIENPGGYLAVAKDDGRVIGGEFNTLSLQLALYFAHIRKGIELSGIAIPARVKGQDVFLEHSLEKTDHVIASLRDSPLPRDVPTVTSRKLQLLRDVDP